MGGYKTDLKLLASQSPDQTWNAIGGDDIVAVDSISDQTGKGTLYIVNLDNNKQIQGVPELAGSRVVNYLRHFSRTLEKAKSQEQEIEEWKTSLRIQGEEITKRQVELDRQQQALQEQQTELSRLEEEKNKLSGAWDQLREEQHRLSENSVNQDEIKQKLESVLSRFTQSINPDDLQNGCQQALSNVQNQQIKLDEYWRELESNKQTIAQKQQELSAKRQDLERRKQELAINQTSLQQAKLELEIQKHLLKQKEDLFKQLNLNLEGIERLAQEVAVISDDDDGEHKVDLNGLESMALGDLEELVSTLQQETAKIVNFVNMQEEELTLQKDEVRSVEHKMASASDIDKLSLETELADAQEAMKLLNETLVGQRRNLKKQQKMLNQHVQILSRRKGANVEFVETINLQPIIDEIDSQRHSLLEQKDKTSGEISHLRQSIEHIQNQIVHLEQDYQQKEQNWQLDEANWQEFRTHVIQMQTKVDFLQESLHPIQDQLNQIRNHLQGMENSVSEIAQNLQQQNQLFDDLMALI